MGGRKRGWSDFLRRGQNGSASRVAEKSGLRASAAGKSNRASAASARVAPQAAQGKSRKKRKGQGHCQPDWSHTMAARGRQTTSKREATGQRQASHGRDWNSGAGAVNRLLASDDLQFAVLGVVVER